MDSHYFIGLDLGQRQDPTALAILERWEEVLARDWVSWGWKKETRFALRHLERMKLGTAYIDVVKRVRDVTRSAELTGRCTLVVDASGVGTPVVELLRQSGLGCSLMAVTITGGDAVSQSDGQFRVPKRDLVVGLQVMMEQQQVRIASGMPEGETLVRELMEMRMKVTAGGHDRYEAGRSGAHDDLVLAVALACWRARLPAVGARRVGRIV